MEQLRRQHLRGRRLHPRRVGDHGRGRPVAAFTDSSPPLRPGVAGYYWGYAYSGASHMQGWIPGNAANLVYAGAEEGHPCALGPAGLDYEVASACGVASTCADDATCGDVNSCEEGIDDCGSETCGAESGGALTPSAHRATVTAPTADAHACTEVTPPDPSVLCMDNGTDVDHYYVYPHGAYLYWAQDSTTKAWLHYGDSVQMYWHTRDGSGVLWDFVEVTGSGSPTFTPASDGAGAGGGCDSDHPEDCTPCQNGGTCGWIQDVFPE